MVNLLFRTNGWHKRVPLARCAKKRDGCAEWFEIIIRAFAYSQTGRYRIVALTEARGSQRPIAGNQQAETEKSESFARFFIKILSRMMKAGPLREW